jgi:O-antigen/teichoic acid export membrane protein
MTIDTHTEPRSMLKAARDAVLASRTTHADSWNAIGVFAVRAISAALLFLTQIAFARWMGASEYGLYVTAWTCVVVLGGLAHLGFNIAMMRLAPQYAANRDYAAFRGLLRAGRQVALITSVLMAAVGVAIISSFYVGDNAALATPLMLGLICLPVYALTDVQDGFGRGQGWTLDAIVPAYVVRPLAMLLFVGIVWGIGLAANADTAMTIALVAALLAAVMQTVLIEKRVAREIPKAAAASNYAKWFTISLPLLAGGICEIIILNADVLVLNFFRPSEEIGHYFAAAKTTGLALFVLYAVGTAYAGRIAAAHTLNNTTEIKSLVGVAVRWTFIPAAVMTAGILVIGYFVLAQFGETFTDAYPLMFILAAGIMTKAAMGPSDTILNMMGHQRATALSLGAAAIFAVALNLVLIPLWGVTGAAIATSTAYAALAAMNWYAVRKLEGLNLFILANLKAPAQP